MITMVNASAMTPRSAIENATPLVLAITTVAAAVPGPQTTRAAVPRNSAATFREKDASALEPIDRPRHPDGVAGLNSLDRDQMLRRRSGKPNNIPQIVRHCAVSVK